MSLRGTGPAEDTRKNCVRRRCGREKKNNAPEANASGSPQISIGQKKKISNGGGKMSMDWDFFRFFSNFYFFITEIVYIFKFRFIAINKESMRDTANGYTRFLESLNGKSDIYDSN
jgi:hypothetical protein